MLSEVLSSSVAAFSEHPSSRKVSEGVVDVLVPSDALLFNLSMVAEFTEQIEDNS